MLGTVLSIDNPSVKTGESTNSKTGAKFQWVIRDITVKTMEGDIKKYVKTFDDVSVGDSGELTSKQNGEFTNWNFKKIKTQGSEAALSSTDQPKETSSQSAEVSDEMRDFIKGLASKIKDLDARVKKLEEYNQEAADILNAMG